MCWFCDDPTMTPQRYMRWLSRTIVEYGWAIQGSC